MGFEIDCPSHPWHRIPLWFANPGDGEPPIAQTALKARGEVARLFQRSGEEWTCLTREHQVEVPGCWWGWILDGIVFTPLVRGVAW
mgnify:CR=1 FL=1